MKNKKDKSAKFSSQSGVVLLISLVLTGILISIVLAVSLIFIPKIRLAGDSKKSAAALYAAESALEWCLYAHNKDPNAVLPVMANGASFVNAATNVAPVSADCSAVYFKIIGTYQGVSRSFEVSGL